MNAVKQAAWLLCALLALACSSLYFASAKPPRQLDDAVLAKTPDMLASQVVVRRFNETGRLIHYLEAPAVQHIPENNTHLLQSPHLSLAEANQPSWEISAKQAKTIKGGEQITFSQNVVLRQNKDKKGQESIMKTEELHYFVRSKLASTDLPVSFEQPGSIVHSKGMKAYLNDKRIRLSQAHATFEPKHV